MNLFGKILPWRKSIAAVCITLVSLILIVCLSVLGSVAQPKSAAKAEASVAEGQIRPNHDYFSVTASLRIGAKIYVGKTTAEDLKRNLIVEGSFQVGGVNYTVKLNPSEYTVACDGVSRGVLVNAMPTGNVTVSVTVNKYNASFDVAPAAFADTTTDIPTYTSLSVANLTGISSDFTENSLIYVSGFEAKGDGTTVITNYEFISVFIASDRKSYTVTYTNPDGSNVSGTGTISATTAPAYITSVLQVNPNYTLKNNYWYDGERSVFVRNMDRENFLKELELVVYYQNGERKLDLTKLGQGASYSYDTGEVVAIAGGYNFDASQATVNFPLNVTVLGGNSVSLSVSVNLEALSVVGLAIADEYLLPNGAYDYTGSTVLKSGTESGVIRTDLLGKVMATYNDGTSKILNATSNAGLSISETALTPTAQDAEGTSYFKTLTLVYTANDADGTNYSVSTKFKVKVEYEFPSTIFFLSGSLATQTYRMPVDYSGIDVMVRYPGNNRTVSIPLADFVAGGSEKYVKTKFYDDNDEIIDTKVFNENVKKIEIALDYNSRPLSEIYEIVDNVNKLPLPLPDIGAFEVTYNKDLAATGKEITFGSEFNQKAFDRLNYYVTKDGDVILDKQDIVNKSQRMTFRTAGTYYLHFTLDDADLPEVRWDDVNINRTYAEIKNEKELVYRIVVAPSEVKIKVVPDGTETVYGTDMGYKVFLAPMGTNDWFELTDDLKTQTGTVVSVSYTGNGTIYSIYPKNVGTYSVHATLTDSSAYSVRATADDPSFEITPATLNAGTVNSFAYDRTDRKIADFIDTSAFGFKYGEGLTGNIKVTDASNVEIDIQNKTYKHVSDAETLNFTIVSGNYTWGGTSKSEKVGIEITALTLGITMTDGNYLDFIHGGVQGGVALTGVPAVTQTVTAKDKMNNDYGSGRFYAVRVTEYYLTKEFDQTAKKPKAGATALTASDFKTWNYEGTDGYVVYIKTTLNSDDASGDYDLPAEFLKFTVSRAQIDRVTFTYDNGFADYDANDRSLTLTEWKSGKMSAAVASTVTTDDTAVNDTTGVITVRHAGKYTVTVELDNNYDWKTDDGAGSHADLTFTFTVNQIELQIQLDFNGFDYDGLSHRPIVSFTSGSISQRELNIVTTTLYDKDKKELTLVPTEIGAYFAAVSKWSMQAADGYDVAKNYKMKYLPFAIVTAAMEKPTLIANGGTLSGADNNTVTVTYTGSQFGFVDFIDNYTVDYTYASNLSKLVVSVNAATAGRREMQDVNTYTVSVTPAENFKWNTVNEDEEQSAVQFTFVISAKRLTGLNWGEATTFVYDGKPHAPEAEPEGVVGGDTVTVAVSGEQINYSATAYIATATALQGARGFNYSLPDSGITQTFTVTKRKINLPTYVSTPLTFGVDTYLRFTLSEGFTDVTGWSWAGVVEAAITSTATTDGTSFDFTTGKFNFVHAGTYTVAFHIKDAHVNNYEWNGDDVASEIEVKKLKINAPGVSGDASNLTFNGYTQTLNFNTNQVPGFSAAWGSVVTYTVSGKYAFNGVNVAHTATDGIAEDTSFSFENGEFSFLNAGSYTIAFDIRSECQKNYEWNGAHVSTVTVNRMTLTAPKLVNPDDTTKTGRTLERNDDDRRPAYIWSGTNHSDKVDVSYGGYGGGTYDPSVTEFKAVGEYYILFAIKSNDYLNYVFQENASDTENLTYVSRYGLTEYEESGVRIYLNYRITRKILALSYAVDGYTFGDNGNVGDQKSINDVIRLSGDDLALLQSGGIYANIGVTQTITFKNGSNNTVGVVVIKRDAGSVSFAAPMTETTYALLENYLPWNAGAYKVQTLIQFDDNQLNDLTGEYDLTVWPKEIAAKWYKADGTTEAGATESVSYNGSEQKLIAVIVNPPARGDGSSESLPALTVGSVSGNRIDAADYTLKVTGIDYTGFTYQNFKLPSSALTYAFKITKAAVNVKSTSVSGHVYGTSYGNLDSLWDLVDGSTFFDGNNGADYVKVRLKNQSGAEVSPATAPIETYTVDLYLSGNGSGNYELNVIENGSFEIVKRAITVSVTDESADLTSVYCAASTVNLHSPAVYKVVWTNNNGSADAAIPSGVNVTGVFTVASGATATNAPANSYDIFVTVGNNGNFDVTVTGTQVGDHEKMYNIGTYTITAAEISVSDVKGSAWSYDAQNHKLIGNAITVGGVAVKGGMAVTYYYRFSADGEEDWKEATNKNLKNVADSGVYYVKITAENHNPKILSPVTVTVSKAELTVGLDLAIYYGEDSPVSRNFLMDASDLTDSRYTVTGFAGPAGATETLANVNATGTLSYTTDYTKGDKAKDYALTLDAAFLSSANYSFKAGASKLTVNALPVTVSVNDISEKYWSVVGQISPVFGNIALGTSATDTYDTTKKVNISGVVKTDILTYSTDAVTVDGSDVVTATADVGRYSIAVKSKDIAGKYVLNGVGADETTVSSVANFEITPAELMLNENVSGYNGVYDEVYHTLTVGGNGAFAETYNSPDNNRNELQVRYYVAMKELELAELETVNFSLTLLPTFMNVGKYYLYYRLSAENHETHIAFTTVEITKADNEITRHFGITDRTGVFESAAAIVRDAWVYGMTGYQSVKPNLAQPAARFDGVANLPDPVDSAYGTVNTTPLQFDITVYFNGNDGSLLTETYHSAADLFDAVCAKGLFNAGTYRVRYVMNGNGNFNDVEEDRYFSVGKKALTVTPTSFVGANAVVYGDAMVVDSAFGTAYTFTLGGLEDSGTGTVDNWYEGYGDVSNRRYALNKRPTFVSDYQAGGFVDEYPVTIDDVADYDSDNYTVTFETGVVEVVKRKITVEIEGKQSSFHYYNDNGAEGKPLTYRFASNSLRFYAGDIEDENQLTAKVFTLYTNATLMHTAGFKTQDVGKYPIFAVFNAISGDAENRTYAYNYKIDIVKAYEGEVTEEILNAVNSDLAVSNLIENAGIYTITPAKLQLIQDADPRYAETETGELSVYVDVANARRYDGYYKGFTASVNIPEGDESADDRMKDVKFYAVYGTVADLTRMHPEMYKDVGTYYYRYVTDNKNYEWDNNSYGSFIISAQQIGVTVTIDDVADANTVVNKVYKADDYRIVFTFGGLQRGEIIDLAVSVTPTVQAGSDAYFASLLGTIYGTFAATNDENSNAYSLNVKNAGMYDVKFRLADTADMKNYTFSYDYRFAVTRKDLSVKANSSVVQYGTAINASGDVIFMPSGTSSEFTEVNATNWNAVADFYRFYGFSLTQNDAFNEDYFVISDVRFGFSGTSYVASATSAYTAGGQNTILNIQPEKNSIHAFNYDIETQLSNNADYGKLYVAQRRIKVTINGYDASNKSGSAFASAIYNGVPQQPDFVTNATKFFTVENQWFGAATGDSGKFVDKTKTKLTVTNAINAGDYPLTAVQNDNASGTAVTNNTNYKVDFVNNAQAIFHIDRKEIKMQAVYAKDGLNSTVFDIIYGDATAGYYKIVYFGMVAADGGNSVGSYALDNAPVDRFALTNGDYTGGISYREHYSEDGATLGEGYYAPWESHAGQKFVVDATDSNITFDNYEIKEKGVAVMTVVARKVTAAVSDVVYTEDTDLHGGKYGVEHNAEIRFTDVKDGSISYTHVDYVNYRPNRYLSYQYVGTENNGAIYNSGVAPTKAGSYTVKITFDTLEHCGDYIFDTEKQSDGTVDGETSVTFDYNVEKKAVSLDWWAQSIEDLTYNDDTENKFVLINSPYVEAITVVNYVQLIKNSVDGQQVENIAFTTGEPANGQYTVTADGFSVKIYSVGVYSVLMVFNEDAVYNYKWDDEDVMSSLSLAFSISAQGFKIVDLTMESWIYNDTDGNGNPKEHKPSYTLTNGVDEVIQLSYATVLGVLPDSVTVGEQFARQTYDRISKTSPSSNIPVNVGTYILVANYTGSNYSSTSAYVVFEIKQREVAAPVFVQANERYVYTGETQFAEITFNSAEITGIYSGNSSLGTEGITLSAVSAGTYSIVFTLNDKRNYRWADGVTEGNSYTIDWVINRATDNEVVWGEEISVTYGDVISPEANSTYGGTLTEYYFAERKVSDEVAPAGLAWMRWTEFTAPVNSGYYWVKAVDNGNSDYNECEAAQKITIKKAWITATASGSAIYGADAADRRFSYEFSGFVKGEENVTVGNIEYVLESAPKHIAGHYDVQLKAASVQVDGKDVVENMSAENYYVTPAVGQFTVTRRSIMVILGSARSIYGNVIDLDNIEIRVVTENGLALDDTVADLGIELEIDADRNVDVLSKFNNVGAYTVNAVNYQNNANYNITVFGSGTYTIAPLPIYITAEAGGGTYDSGNIQGAEITGIYAVSDNQTINVVEVFGDRIPTFSFHYWGTSNDGKWNKSNGDNCTVEPDRAGVYHATAVASNSDNFTLLTNIGMPSVTFTVEKKVIDESVITVEKQAYANAALTPVVTDSAYRGIYTVTDVSAVDVGTYNVPITLIDGYNYKWTSVEDAVYNLTFEIVKGNNEIDKPEIKGWTYLAYDEKQNTPTADVKFGSAADFTFAYATAKDGDYSANVPADAGKYWVKITVPQTDNYYAVTSEPTEFVIEKAELGAPALMTVTEGENQNVTYTGSRLQATVNGYDAKTMRIIYDGDTAISSFVAVFAVNAGTYTVKFALNDSVNYVWTKGVALDSDGNATLTWSVARKKLEKPTMNTDRYMVNGKTLTFIPDGFDEETMSIIGNKTSYGGVFDVEVLLKDTVNYEWTDATVAEVTFAWTVVGWDTVFIIVVSALGVVAGIAGLVILIQFAVHKVKKRKERAADKAADEEFARLKAKEKAAQENAESENVGENNESEPTEEQKTEEQKLEETEQSEEVKQPEESENAESAGNSENDGGNNHD